MKQHKWHKEIKAWADGAEIESRAFDVMINQWSSWSYEENPKWYDHKLFEYQIKPQPIPSYKGDPTPTHVKKPKYLYVYLDDDYEFSPIKLNTKWTYIGKIKIEE